ncbi:unnamed protein product [Durusdinium trenchii]|uniref:Rubisco LSMT substrate-binding domain-containing protein n=1 Tax=Durusdinium trenchii TaxID=1381693 RepID=A0ABP0S7E8_9DINO
MPRAVAVILLGQIFTLVSGHGPAKSWKTLGTPGWKTLRRFLRQRGGVWSSALESGPSEGQSRGSTCVARRAIPSGELLFEIPIDVALWRGTATVGRSSWQHFSALTQTEELILFLAMLMKSNRQLGDSPLATYAALLTQEPPPSSVLWDLEELGWLSGTEAGTMTEHFLRRLARIHAAAPLLVEYSDLKVAFAQYYARHLKLPLGAEQAEPIMLPGIDSCRHREGSAKAVFLPERRVVQLRSSTPLKPGDELFVDAGVEDTTDLLLKGDERVDLKGFALRAGELLAVPLEENGNHQQKRLLLQQLAWPREVRLRSDEVEDLQSLRLASMPDEEFTAWSVGALVGGAPLAVSRAFRTELRASKWLFTMCGAREEAARWTPDGLEQAVSNQASRARIASRYRQTLAEVYQKCRSRAGQKLEKLQSWAMKQHSWVFDYIREAVQNTQKQSAVPPEAWQAQVAHVTQLVAAPMKLSLPTLQDKSQIYEVETIVALVNSKVQDFIPYFEQLLQASSSNFHLDRVTRLALAMARLKGVACGADLTDFQWINQLRGKKDVLGTFKYLLPEMEKLHKEFQRQP